MPVPRGKKSRPTICSNTEDFPEDCEPITTICGRSNGCLPMAAKTSCSLFTIGISCCIPLSLYCTPVVLVVEDDDVPPEEEEVMLPPAAAAPAAVLGANLPLLLSFFSSREEGSGPLLPMPPPPPPEDVCM